MYLLIIVFWCCEIWHNIEYEYGSSPTTLLGLTQWYQVNLGQPGHFTLHGIFVIKYAIYQGGSRLVPLFLIVDNGCWPSPLLPYYLKQWRLWLLCAVTNIVFQLLSYNLQTYTLEIIPILLGLYYNHNIIRTAWRHNSSANRTTITYIVQLK